ncbi:5-formyltetrahydrofolate cyclo-ligase [Maritalea porphyrae]|uniref:5-formyltetrahydrofolate cyclo-ligase n=1 Tax=Maritalea porphyrae TaxID=880732 RepID=UPI0022AE74C0|nr:5-formyltetrahydrofolate cyclo-ligase [Maritalea porphyrae]MCZ4273935.1 5-formyltetrahydrofolate cyclo-ligase [Maritalea porphyrae]
MASSPTCLLEGFKENWCGELVEYDAGAAKDVAVWRKAERQRLIEFRQAMSNDERQEHGAIVCARLFDLIKPNADHVISAYWPFKGELDLRPFMEEAIGAGATIVLPVVEIRAAPLAFRRWTPEAKMERGIWNILQPIDPKVFHPNVVIAPLVGFDEQGYRLGHGGGYYDRTLATFDVQPFKIGVGFKEQRLETIYPQPHDVPMDAILHSSDLLNLNK